MTRQEKKNILNKYPSICERISELRNQLEEIQTAGEKITQSYDVSGSTSSGNTSKVERAALKLPEIKQQLQECERQKQLIDEAVQNSLRGNQRDLIKMVYFDGVSQNRVAQILHKTPNTIRTVLNRAVDTLKID